MTELPSLSIVIPSYNARELLARSLSTLQQVARGAEVIVVDGASADGSADMVERDFPEVILVRQKNHGFAHATNRGIERASRPFVLLMNSDLFLTREALDAMHARLAADARLGAVAPRLVNEDGSRQTVFGAFYWPNWVEVKEASRVWLVSGACFMTRRDVIERVGALDESFFLYNEEYDWCTRCRDAGYHLEMVPAPVVHVGGGSTGKSPDLTLEAQRGFLYVAQKHAPPIVAEALRRAMLFEGYCKSRIDPRPEHRSMWAKLESIMRREAYLESPFPVSGRGDSVARPNGLSLTALSVSMDSVSMEAVSMQASMEASSALTESTIRRTAAARLEEDSGARPLPLTGEGARVARPSNVLPFRREPRRKARTRRAAV
ncbi:MAG: glycosyltransferase family 2 protein [Deltaproteobacteria bacterium]|nr:glycosyltransferase family 2 protein [Deltaproteobacteria bacterium]